MCSYTPGLEGEGGGGRERERETETETERDMFERVCSQEMSMHVMRESTLAARTLEVFSVLISSTRESGNIRM